MLYTLKETRYRVIQTK